MRAVLALLGALALPVASLAETIAGTGISTFPYTITTPGLYHLTANNGFGNRTNGETIRIQLSEAYRNADVVLDLNAHTIEQTNTHYSTSLGVGAYPTGIKVVSTGTGRVTVRNGTLRGFGVGIDITGNQFLVEDMTVIGASRFGILTSGNAGVIRNNHVIGATDQVPYTNRYSGISCVGNGIRIINNDVQDVTVVAYDAFGIYFAGNDFISENNRVSNIANGPSLPGCGIAGFSSNAGLIVNSRITSCYYGVYIDSTGPKYRDNLASNSTIPYTGGTDAGNNQ